MLRKAIEYAARLFKGQDYRIDPSLPLVAVFGFAGRRAIGLMRCIFRGIKFSINPKKLIFIGSNVELLNQRFIRFGAAVTLGKGVMIDGLSRQGVEIGDRVSIGPYSIIEATGVMTSMGVGCRIGANSGLGAFSFIGAAGGVWVGENVIMGQRVSFHSENHCFDRDDIPIRLQGVTRQGITVEDDCWIGANVVFLDGAHVGKGCIIGAGSVVRGHIPVNSVAVGVPAKVIRPRVKGCD